MNKSTFILTGGYPLKAERLQELQTAYNIFNSLGALAGNFTIISGCVVAGTTVGNGVVYINGEVIDFREADGAGTPDVIIIEEAVNRAFKNGVIKQVHTIRYATFGTAADSWPWSGFKRLDPIILMMARLEVLEKKTAVFQSGGGMVFWNKPAADIPTGWQEVVDWRGRMPVGFDVSQPDFDTLGKIGGAKSKTLSITEIPSHSHGLGLSTGGANSDGGNDFVKNSTTASTFSTKNKGGGESFSILNPYRTVLFIEYTL